MRALGPRLGRDQPSVSQRWSAADSGPGDSETEHYVLRLIAARYGDEIADQVVPVAIFGAVMQVVEALQERLDATLEAMGHRESQAA